MDKNGGLDNLQSQLLLFVSRTLHPSLFAYFHIAPISVRSRNSQRSIKVCGGGGGGAKGGVLVTVETDAGMCVPPMSTWSVSGLNAAR